MNKRDRRELERYIRGVADEMGLRDWTLTVDVATPARSTSPDPDHVWCATCRPVPGRKHATLTFDPSCRHDDRDDLRQSVVHELVHCHFWGLWDTLRRDTCNLIGHQETYDLWISGVERHMEFGVDAVADAIAPRMPVIEWPEKRK